MNRRGLNADTGEILLVDIGVLPQVYRRIGIEVPVDLFAAGGLVRV